MTRTTRRPLYGLIYAGGAGLRLGGLDKARLSVAQTDGPDAGQPSWLIARVAAALRPQVERVVIARARHDDALLAFGDVVVDAPAPGDPAERPPIGRDKPQCGPLAGLIAALRRWPDADWLTVPVDGPTVPETLARRLCPPDATARHPRYLHDGERPQPLHAFVPAHARSALEDLWQRGERSVIRAWRALDAEAIFAADLAPTLVNLNTPADLARAGVATSGVSPTRARVWLAVTAPSGTGKTTLLTQVLERLRQQNLPPGAVVKHSHHRIAFDPPHKDSARLLEAGGQPTLLITRDAARLIAPLDSAPPPPDADDGDPVRDDVLTVADRWLPARIAWVLVEGCAHCQHPRLERLRLWRPPSSPLALTACSTLRAQDGDGATATTCEAALADAAAQARDDSALRAWAVPRAYHETLSALIARTLPAGAARPVVLDLDDPAAVAAWVTDTLRRRLATHGAG